MNKKKMKKMTNEEKARAFDEALDRCKEWASGTCGHNVADSPKDIAEFIFPQLAESKDEKIREFLIGILSQGTWRKEWPFSPNEVVAYLERQNHVQSDTEKEYVRTLKSLIFNFLSGKDEVDRDYYQRIEDWLDGKHVEQKEQKPINHNLTTWHRDVVYCAMCDKNLDEGLRCNLEVVYKTIKELVDRTPVVEEQKPAEWSEEEEQRIAEIEFAVMQMNTKRVDTKDKCLAWLKSLRPQSKQEWSEEDERILKGIIGLIDHDQHYGVSNNEMISWLKSLRPQLKQKWSEEDKKMLWIIQLALTKHPITDKQEKDAFDWLNSLHPQPHTVSIKDATKFGNLEYERGVKDGIQSEKSRQWKPTEEQIYSLSTVVKGIGNVSVGSVEYNLKALYEQLKKLM